MTTELWDFHLTSSVGYITLRGRRDMCHVGQGLLQASSLTPAGIPTLVGDRTGQGEQAGQEQGNAGLQRTPSEVERQLTECEEISADHII